MGHPGTAPVIRLPHGRAERTIAATRLMLAALALFAVWFDPNQPARDTPLAQFLYPGYLVYAGLIGFVIWSPGSLRLTWLPTATFVVDLVVLSVFQYLISTPPNPIFLYFVFILFCAALRWGWSGALRTIPFGAGLVLGGSSMTRGLDPQEFELNHIVIRVGYLTMIGALLVYLGRYEAGRRNEIQRLAHWPPVEGTDESTIVRSLVEYGARLMDADGAVVAWSVDEEPRTVLARWTPSAFDIVTHPPGEVDPPVAEALGSDPFLCSGGLAGEVAVMVRRAAGVEVWRGTPVHAAIASSLAGASTGSAAFATDRLSGRIFVVWSERRTADVLPLLEAVARQTGVSIDQMRGRDQQRRLAVADERMRLARDLHDGVLQSLTGVRFDLQRLWRELGESTPDDTARRLQAMERTLSDEQRELRLFIEDLKPAPGHAAAGSVRRRIGDLCERLSAQWRVPIEVHVDEHLPGLPLPVDHAVLPMVHEAVINALKHGDPSRVRVAVQRAGDSLEVVVTDDGRGFEFEGEFDHQALMARRLGPVSLRDRLASLGGQLAIKSSAAGARVRIGLPCGPARS